MEVKFELVPEHYVGEYPCATIKIKKSQLTPDVKSKLQDAIEEI